MVRVVGCWFVGAGGWLLVRVIFPAAWCSWCRLLVVGAGCWLLVQLVRVVGCWFVGAGCWLLLVDHVGRCSNIFLLDHIFLCDNFFAFLKKCGNKISRKNSR